MPDDQESHKPLLTLKQLAALSSQPIWNSKNGKHTNEANGWRYLRIRLKSHEWDALQSLAYKIGIRRLVGNSPELVSVAVLVRALANGIIGVVETQDLKRAAYVKPAFPLVPFRNFGEHQVESWFQREVAKRSKAAGARKKGARSAWSQAKLAQNG